MNIDDLDDSLFDKDGNDLQYPSSPPLRPNTAEDYMDVFERYEKTTTYKSGNNYTRPPSTGAFVSAVCPTTGKNLYFAKKTKAESKRKMEALFSNITSGKGHKKSLLSKPIWKLRLDIEKSNKEALEKIQK